MNIDFEKFSESWVIFFIRVQLIAVMICILPFKYLTYVAYCILCRWQFLMSTLTAVAKTRCAFSLIEKSSRKRNNSYLLTFKDHNRKFSIYIWIRESVQRPRNFRYLTTQQFRRVIYDFSRFPNDRDKPFVLFLTTDINNSNK